MSTPPLEISCSFPPSLSTPDGAALAESLGYSKVWLYDGPALYADIWVTLARVAESTSSIGLGAGVLVPSLRHVMTNAAAIATLAELAPGRVSIALGTGFGGTLLLGERPVRWSAVAAYLRALRGLLCGETVELSGRRMKMLHPPGFTASRPLNIPILVAANGPRGLEVALELGDGVFSYYPQPRFSWSAVPLHGTVLDAGERLDSPRVLEVAGVGLTMICHGLYESAPPGLAIDDLPGGAEWRRTIDALPEDARHLAVHESHLSESQPATACSYTQNRSRSSLSPALPPICGAGSMSSRTAARRKSSSSRLAPIPSESCERLRRWQD